MNRTISFFLLALIIAGSLTFAQEDINQKMGRLDLKTAGLKEVIALLGEPDNYRWNNQTFQKENLPAIYIAYYPNGLRFVLNNGMVSEIRNEGPTGYRFKDKLEVGSSLELVLEILGQPTQTVSGQKNQWADGVLYKDIDGQKGYCYYQRSNQNVRLFLVNYKVTAMYITNPYANERGGGGSGDFTTVKPVDKADFYDDVRYKDLSKIPGIKNDLIRSLRFNQSTVWPQQAVGTKTIKWVADKVLQSAMNPGLGVRQLHKMGITGKGVNVAIIDQPLYQDHPEFKGKIAAYHDVGCESKSSMHGPAVASLLVGENCGTAPGAKVYYVAAPSWTQDAAFQAKALEWIIEQNRQLPIGQKIRVVSVSAAPSGQGSPFDKNNSMWDQACQKAEAEGIMVLDCTQHQGIILGSHFEGPNIENPAFCLPGSPSNKWTGGSFPSDKLFVPTCPRTSAEEYDEGVCTYAYWGQGGLSWAIPYAAGVLAMGWQTKPDATPEQMKELLLKTAYQTKEGAKIINPTKFIQALQKGEQCGLIVPDRLSQDKKGSANISASPAFADAVEPLLNAKTITCRFSSTIQMGDTEMKQPPAICTYQAPSRMRIEMPEEGAFAIVDMQTDRMLMLLLTPKDKTAMKLDIPLPLNPEVTAQASYASYANYFDLRETILRAQNKGTAELLPETVIEGRKVIVYRIRETDNEVNSETTLWIDKKTFQPVQTKMTMKIGSIRYSYEETDFEFDKEITPDFFSMEVPTGYTVVPFPIDLASLMKTPDEESLIEMFRLWTHYMDGKFPPDLTVESMAELTTKSMEGLTKRMKELKSSNELITKHLKEATKRMEHLEGTNDMKDVTATDFNNIETPLTSYPDPNEFQSDTDTLINQFPQIISGIMFAQTLPKESDWHYAGKDAVYGDAKTPIFWYRPKDASAYRVIYADLSVKDIPADQLPAE